MKIFDTKSCNTTLCLQKGWTLLFCKQQKTENGSKVILKILNSEEIFVNLSWMYLFSSHQKDLWNSRLAEKSIQ